MRGDSGRPCGPGRLGKHVAGTEASGSKRARDDPSKRSSKSRRTAAETATLLTAYRRFRPPSHRVWLRRDVIVQGTHKYFGYCCSPQMGPQNGPGCPLHCWKQTWAGKSKGLSFKSWLPHRGSKGGRGERDTWGHTSRALTLRC